MKKNRKRIIFGILIILNCMAIFYFSNQVADNSSRQSSRVVETISNIIPTIKTMQEPDKTLLQEQVLTPIVRKGAHFSIYALLGFWTMNFMMTIENRKLHQLAIYALIFCFLYAGTDEFHQFFIQGRSAELRDVLIDSSGALIGILFTIAITTGIAKLKRKQKGS